jgi:hypothetical protein
MADTTTQTPNSAARKKSVAPTSPRAPASPVKAKTPILRTIPAGSKIADDAVVTLVAAANPKAPGSKANARFARYPKSATVRDVLKIDGGPVMADLRYDYERAFIDIVPPPTRPAKK